MPFIQYEMGWGWGPAMTLAGAWGRFQSIASGVRRTKGAPAGAQKGRSLQPTHRQPAVLRAAGWKSGKQEEQRGGKEVRMCKCVV